MKHRSAETAQASKIIRSLLLAVAPLSGCAFPGTENQQAGWRSLIQSPTASARADIMASSPPATAFPLAGPEEIPASSGASAPLVRLASDESISLAAQAPAPGPPRLDTELARAHRHPVSPPNTRGVLHASTATFDQQVLRTNAPVLVDFYASWCGPCRALAPTLDELAAENPQAKVVKVNIDDSPELAARYGVTSVPSLMVFRQGKVAAKQQGMVSKSQLQAMLAL